MPGMQGLSAWIAQTTGFGSGACDCYDFDQSTGVLGAGSFGKVLTGRSKATGSTCAIKQVSKLALTNANTLSDRMMQARETNLKQEIDIMRMLDHRHIVRLFDNFEDDVNYYVVMELCAGGRLVDCVAQSQDFRESDAAIIMKQLFSALEYIHGKHVVHRDVKPDNMLFDSSKPIKENTLKLIDFGLSCRCKPGQELRLAAGTPDFMSPQAIDGCYDSKTDMWSCGATMFMLLCGNAPFRAETDSGVFAKIRRGNFNLSADEWRNISDEAKDLVRSLLKMNPRERSSSESALGHPWLRIRAGSASDGHLQTTIARFRMGRAKRNQAQPEENMFADVRAAWAEVTHWANSLLPQAQQWEDQARSRPGMILVSI